MKTQSIAGSSTGLARRAFLTGLAVTIPTAAMAATAARASADTQPEIDHLIVLRDRLRELDGQTPTLEERLAELETAYLQAADQPPAGLTIRLADRRLLRGFGAERWKGHTHFEDRDIKQMRGRRVFRNVERFAPAGMTWEQMQAAPEVAPIGTLGIDYDILRTREPWPLAQRRLDSIVAAFDRWQADKEQLRAGMGVDDAEEALERHNEMVDAAVNAIAEASATSAAALKVKAGIMTDWPDGGDHFDDWRKIAVMSALLDDIAKLGVSA